MEDKDANKIYRLVQVKGGYSASYLANNMTRSDKYVAIIKNGSMKSRVVIYWVEDLENEALEPEHMRTKTIDWDTTGAKAAECTHINYLSIN